MSGGAAATQRARSRTQVRGSVTRTFRLLLPKAPVVGVWELEVPKELHSEG